MRAKYVFAFVAAVFLAASLLRMSGGGGIPHPQTRTWLLVAAIFAGVSAWLFTRP
jgi:hypothetical protein